MLCKRTTAPHDITGPMGIATCTPRRRAISLDRRITPTRLTRSVVELARGRRRLRHRPTVAQLKTMVRFAGCEPCSYRLDRAVNWLPESLPVGFPLGATGLCFVHREGELVVLPDGSGFALT
jgi:hypothetical protein